MITVTEAQQRTKGNEMKLLPRGAFVDHNSQRIAYKLRREDAQYVCDIDPHAVGEWDPAGRGKNHAAAIQAARAWWQQYDTAQ